MQTPSGSLDQALLLTALSYSQADCGGLDATHSVDRHIEVWRDAVNAAGGVTVKRVANGILARFATIAACLDAAASGQRQTALNGSPALLSRAAIHSGRLIAMGDDIAGLPINRCARILELAAPGQVLISGSSRRLSDSAEPTSCHLRRLGLFRLRDLQEPEELWEIWGTGLPTDFPPLPNLAYPPRVPAPVDRFIGRQAELQRLSELVAKQKATAHEFNAEP